MAKLYSSLNTNRNRPSWRSEQVHRLGDHWVEALVKSWDHSLNVKLNSDGSVAIWVDDLHQGAPRMLYFGPIDQLYQSGTFVVPSPVAPPKKPKRSALDRDVQQFLKESA